MLRSEISVRAVFHFCPLTVIVHKIQLQLPERFPLGWLSVEFKCIPRTCVLDFDRRVNDNKTAAEEALRRIPAINQTIMEANEKTREAQLALGNAAADATEAKNRAHEAERIASAVRQVRAFLCSHISPLISHSLS